MMTHAPPAWTDSLNRRCGWDEPSLDELLADEIMAPIMRSTHVDRDRLRRQLPEVALRVYVRTAAPAD